MSDLQPPKPIDGQGWPTFPSSRYEDAWPDRPFTIVLPPLSPPSLPIYTPPVFPGPPPGIAASEFSISSLDLPTPSLTVSAARQRRK